ncbi:MAG: insulinase family protein [Owenweeksia sp.]|nr:insulinase family protein [Owenweeksia sp.]
MDAEVVDTVYDNIQLPGLFLGYRIPPQGTEDAYALEVLNTVLSGGQSSRFYKTLVDESNWVWPCRPFHTTWKMAASLSHWALPTWVLTVKALKEGIDNEIDKVRDELISEREYKKVINQLESDFIASNSTMSGIAESLANYHVYFDNANLINTEIEKYRAVSREDIKRVANKYLSAKNRVILYYLPKEQMN